MDRNEVLMLIERAMEEFLDSHEPPGVERFDTLLYLNDGYVAVQLNDKWWRISVAEG